MENKEEVLKNIDEVFANFKNALGEYVSLLVKEELNKALYIKAHQTAHFWCISNNGGLWRNYSRPQLAK